MRKQSRHLLRGVLSSLLVAATCLFSGSDTAYAQDDPDRLAPTATRQPPQPSPASTAQADRRAVVALDVIRSGIGGDNPFTEDLPQGKHLFLCAGTSNYYVFDLRKEGCYLRLSTDDSSLHLFDRGCNGTLDAKSVGKSNKAKWNYQPSQYDKTQYVDLLQDYAPFVTAMRQYKSWNPSPSLNFLRLAPVVAENNRILAGILKLMAGTSATKLEKTKNSIEFHGGNERGIALFAKHDGYHYTGCNIHEYKPGNEFIAVDDDCNGGMDFVQDTRPFRKSDPIGNAEVYKSLLLDMERFLKAAVKALPR